MAYVWAYGPKYSLPLRLRDLVTRAWGHSWERVMTRYGYDLSSTSLTLNRGRCLLISVYSSMRAATSESVMIHSTVRALSTIAWVRG